MRAWWLGRRVVVKILLVVGAIVLLAGIGLGIAFLAGAFGQPVIKIPSVRKEPASVATVQVEVTRVVEKVVEKEKIVTVVVEQTRVVEKQVVVTATPAPATATSTPMPTFTSMPPTATPISTSEPTETVVVRVVGTVTSVATAAAVTASSGTPVTPIAVDSVPLNAVKLTVGQAVIPNWGYGPWGVQTIVYPKVQPGGTLPLGPSQAVTDFNGRNWVPAGEWTFVVPKGVKEIFVTVQGDAPAEVVWEGQKLTFRSNAEISKKAPFSLDNTPRLATGSTGVSLVVFCR